jgi:hypothetical protein
MLTDPVSILAIPVSLVHPYLNPIAIFLGLEPGPSTDGLPPFGQGGPPFGAGTAQPDLTWR